MSSLNEQSTKRDETIIFGFGSYSAKRTLYSLRNTFNDVCCCWYISYQLALDIKWESGLLIN